MVDIQSYVEENLMVTQKLNAIRHMAYSTMRARQQ